MNTNPALKAELNREAQERRGLYGLAAKVRDAVRTAESEARRQIWSLVSLRRQAEDRLSAISDNQPEKPSHEEDLCWEVLQYVADHELRAHASYILAALATPGVRLHWALHAEDRVGMIDAALELGWVAGTRGYFEVRS